MSRCTFSNILNYLLYNICLFWLCYSPFSRLLSNLFSILSHVFGWSCIFHTQFGVGILLFLVGIFFILTKWSKQISRFSFNIFVGGPTLNYSVTSGFLSLSLFVRPITLFQLPEGYCSFFLLVSNYGIYQNRSKYNIIYHKLCCKTPL